MRRGQFPVARPPCAGRRPTCPAATGRSSPPRTHLAGDARDERHLPGLAHLAVPGAPEARAASGRVSHVCRRGRVSVQLRGRRSGTGGGPAETWVRAPVASPSCSGRHSLTGRAGGRAWSEGRAGPAGAGGGSRAAAWLAPRHSSQPRRVSGAPCGPAPTGVSALSHAPLGGGA